MNRFILLFNAFLLFSVTAPAFAQLNVFACEQEWAALVTTLGGDQVDVYAATTAHQDPHHIQARPSLIAKVRRADLVICSGAELEIGWLPMLLRQAGNSSVLPGKPGYFEASHFVERLEIPKELDRAMGDVHASGNPHIHLDPHRLATIADALTDRLSEIDTANAEQYRNNHQAFSLRWQEAMLRWEKTAAPLKGTRVVVHHKDWVYLFDWLGILEAGALEPKPGLPTSVGHLSELKRNLASDPAKMIVHTAYQDDRAARRLSEMSGIPVVELPHTVGGSEKANDLFGLFDDTIERLLKAVP